MIPAKLNYFITLGSILSYTKAAKILNISQPTLSHNIAALEEELGVKLFEKRGRTIRLTKGGEIFLQHSKDSVKLLEDGRMLARKMDSNLHGTISVGHINIQADKTIPDYIQGFLSVNGSINTQFDLHVDTTHEIMNGLVNDTYDIGFCFKCKLDGSVEYIPLWKEEFVMIVNKSHPLADKETITLADTLEYPHIIYNDKSILYKPTQEYYNLMKQYPTVVSTVEVVSAMVGMVSKGVGIGLVPISAVESNDVVVKLQMTGIVNDKMIYLSYAGDKYQIPAVKRFIHYMKTYHKYDRLDVGR